MLISLLTAKLRLLSVAALVISAAAGPQTASGQGLLQGLLTSVCVRQSCGSFLSPTGHPVPVEKFLPKCGGRAPAVILLHGSDGGTRYAEAYRTAARGLAAQGYAAFIVYYFEGEPNAPRPREEDRDLPDRRAFIPWLATVGASISYVQAQCEVDPSRIGLLGFSLGGFLANAAAVQDPRVRAVTSLSGGLPPHLASRLRSMPPALIVHGQCDDVVPVAEAYRLHALLATRRIYHDLHILPNEGHLPYRCSTEAVAQKVLCFFNAHL